SPRQSEARPAAVPVPHGHAPAAVVRLVAEHGVVDLEDRTAVELVRLGDQVVRRHGADFDGSGERWTAYFCAFAHANSARGVTRKTAARAPSTHVDAAWEFT